MILDGRTPSATSIGSLGWLMIIIATIVVTAVVIYLLVGLVAARRRAGGASSPGAIAPDMEPSGWGTWAIIIAGMIVPAAVLLLVLGDTMTTLQTVNAASLPGRLAPPQDRMGTVGGATANTPGTSGTSAAGSTTAPPISTGATGGARTAEPAGAAGVPVTILVVGHQYWWEVRYPLDGVVTANEIHIPTGQPVRFLVTSDDVIHSFWVPQLMGKVDMIPGRTNALTVQTDKPGEYRGQCAEYCGLEHAHMIISVMAEPPAEYATWLHGQQQVPAEPSDSLVRRGRQVFLGSSCTYCHTVQGTNASGTLGPDLTHLASRKTLGAGTLPNTVGALGGWIEDPQSAKPGNKMPPMQLDGGDLQALLAYLETLK